MRQGDADFSEDCIAHLQAALELEDPAEKDFHIRQVLQANADKHSLREKVIE